MTKPGTGTVVAKIEWFYDTGTSAGILIFYSDGSWIHQGPVTIKPPAFSAVRQMTSADPG